MRLLQRAAPGEDLGLFFLDLPTNRAHPPPFLVRRFPLALRGLAFGHDSSSSRIQRLFYNPIYRIGMKCDRLGAIGSLGASWSWWGSMMAAEGEEAPSKKRGHKGGVKHQPGRGHDRKSAREKKRRFARKARRKREQERKTAEEEWAKWDALPDDVKRLLGPTAQPKLPRPTDEEQDSDQ